MQPQSRVVAVESWIKSQMYFHRLIWPEDVRLKDNDRNRIKRRDSDRERIKEKIIVWEQE